MYKIKFLTYIKCMLWEPRNLADDHFFKSHGESRFVFQIHTILQQIIFFPMQITF